MSSTSALRSPSAPIAPSMVGPKIARVVFAQDFPSCVASPVRSKSSQNASAACVSSACSSSNPANWRPAANGASISARERSWMGSVTRTIRRRQQALAMHLGRDVPISRGIQLEMLLSSVLIMMRLRSLPPIRSSDDRARRNCSQSSAACFAAAARTAATELSLASAWSATSIVLWLSQWSVQEFHPR